MLPAHPDRTPPGLACPVLRRFPQAVYRKPPIAASAGLTALAIASAKSPVTANAARCSRQRSKDYSSRFSLPMADTLLANNRNAAWCTMSSTEHSRQNAHARFDDAWEQYRSALETLEAGDVRDACGKAWNATRAAAEAAVLAHNGGTATTTQISSGFRRLSRANG